MFWRMLTDGIWYHIPSSLLLNKLFSFHVPSTLLICKFCLFSMLQKKGKKLEKRMVLGIVFRSRFHSAFRRKTITKEGLYLVSRNSFWKGTLKSPIPKNIKNSFKCFFFQLCSHLFTKDIFSKWNTVSQRTPYFEKTKGRKSGSPKKVSFTWKHS